MARKLYIRTFGCQMNEYDSAKMADVLRASHGLEPTADPALADVILFNTCSVREKAQEKVFHDLGRVKHLKRERPGVLIGVGGCVASQEGPAHREARALRRFRVRAADAASAARDDRGAARDRPIPGRHLVPRDRKVRPPSARARGRRDRFRLDHGRLQQVLHVLRRAVHARRGSVARLRGRADRSRGACRAGRKRSDAARPERECVPRKNRGRRYGGPGTAHRIRGGDSRHRPHSLHHIASA